MTANFQGATPGATYKSLLHVDNDATGVDGTLRRVLDGEGTSSALSVSTDAAKIDGPLEVTGLLTRGGRNAFPWLDVTQPPYNAVPGQESTAAIQAALDDAKTLGGGVVFIPWPEGSLFIVSGNGLSISSNVRLMGGGSPGTGDSTKQHIKYTGTGACIWNLEGHNDTGQTRDMHLEHIGILLDTAGSAGSDSLTGTENALATGFRLWRARYCTIKHCSVRLTKDRQCGFHFRAEKDTSAATGTYQGIFDSVFMHLRSQSAGSPAGGRHFYATGQGASSGRTGQFNTNVMVDCRAINDGKAFRFGAGINNTLIGLTAEGQANDDQMLYLDDDFTESRIIQFYMERPAGAAPSVRDIFQNTNSDYVTLEDVLLGNATTLANSRLRANTTLTNRGRRYRGAGGSVGPFIDTAEHFAITRMHTFTANVSSITPNLDNGVYQTVETNIGTTLTINAPTALVSDDDTVNFFWLRVKNTHGSSALTLSWNAVFTAPAWTSLAAGKEATVGFILAPAAAGAHKWKQINAAVEL